MENALKVKVTYRLGDSLRKREIAAKGLDMDPTASLEVLLTDLSEEVRDFLANYYVTGSGSSPSLGREEGAISVELRVWSKWQLTNAGKRFVEPEGTEMDKLEQVASNMRYNIANLQPWDEIKNRSSLFTYSMTSRPLEQLEYLTQETVSAAMDVWFREQMNVSQYEENLRIKLNERINALGPIYNELLEEERKKKAAEKEAENRRKEEAVIHQEAFEAEMADWIKMQGSTRLNRGIEHGYDMESAYITERASIEFPDFVRDVKDQARWETRYNPSEEALVLLEKTLGNPFFREGVYDARIVWLTKSYDDEVYDFKACEAVAISHYLDRPANIDLLCIV